MFLGVLVYLNEFYFGMLKYWIDLGLFGIFIEMFVEIKKCFFKVKNLFFYLIECVI